jgi:uncharacterized glyoxalase superfamily protein PhnB
MKPNIFPVVRYADARQGIDWLVRVLGFEVQVEHPGPGGTVGHAELRRGAGLVTVSSAGVVASQNPWTSVRHGVYVAVRDIDAHYERARAAGVEIAMPIHDTDYGSRDYSARDLAGRLWGFGTYDMAAGEGEPDIYPELHYATDEAVAWLERSFGFRPTARIPGPDGRIVHAEMRLGDGTVMLSLGGDQPQAAATSVRIDDPDAHHARARAEGAEIVVAPMTTHYGARMYWVRDPEGFLWGFSTYQPAADVAI